jgi:hypothetical protein
MSTLEYYYCRYYYLAVLPWNRNYGAYVRPCLVLKRAYFSAVDIYFRT